MGLIPNSFDGLVSSIVDLAEDDSQEFLNYVPTAIFLAEERMMKEVEKQGLHVTASVTASVGNPLVAKPNGYRFTYDLHIIDSSGSASLPRRTTREFIKDYWPNQTVTDRPKYYSDWDVNSFIVAPTPNGPYVFVLNYSGATNHVGVSNQTNWFTSNCPDTLFYATMCNMCEYMKDYSTMKQWETKYQDSVKALNNEGRRERRDSDAAQSNPAGANTLDGSN